jgi:hypothetical protein
MFMTRDGLNGAKIQRAFADDASGKEFEEFFRRLLEAELHRRHQLGTTKVHGPTKSGKADGGKDCILTVHEPPRIARRANEDLTWDEPGETYYSLKTGTKWPQSVFEDVGYNGRLNVAGGGRYVIVISEPADDGENTLARVRSALGHHMEREGLSPASGWEDRINFLDANVLASFIRQHRPILPREIERKLGLDWPRELDRFDDWTRRFDRELPEYVPDSARQDFIDLIAQLGDARVIRVFGPPGVGKTRMVHRALERLDELELERNPEQLSRPTDSVYYTDNSADAENVVYSPWLRHDAGAVILVADEVGSTEVDVLARNFLARAPKDSGARLLLIGVSDEDVYEGMNRNGVLGFALGALSPDATRKLVEGQLGSAKPELVSGILALAEGFPLFAILLAEALAQDERALAKGSDESTRWDAAKRVLAGAPRRYGGDEVRWRAEANRRALCLLVVIMTGDQDLAWDDLWQSLGDDLRRLIGDTSDWQGVKNAEAECVARGLLRRVGSSNKRYVSPANLARMILNHFFGEGPNDLGPRLVQCEARLQDRVHTMAQRFNASQSVRDKLSRGLLAEFERRRIVGEPLADLIDARSALYIAAERLPDDTAWVLSKAILQHDHEALAKQTRLRHQLRGVFQELVQERVSKAEFAALEAALFAMALVDDERWANNATGIWRSLFLVALSQTYQPWNERFRLLTQRCREGSAAERVFAISGLAVAVASDERGLGHAPGREWPIPTEAEYRERKREAWELLLELCGSEETNVAAAARKVVADKLRGCIMDDVALDAAFLRALGERVGGWDVTQRRHLAETLADIHRYDYAELDDELQRAIDELDVRLNPSNFVERLVGQVGSWHPGPWQIDEPRREELEAREDEALVAEALEQPQLLVAQWPWLTSSAAVRQRSFMRTLGRLDTHHRFLPELEAKGRELLPWYIEGWSQVAPTHVDAWLARQLADGPYEDVAIFVLPFLEPTDRRLEWIIDRVDAGSVHVPALSALRYRWVANTSASLMLRLIDACAARAECIPTGVALVRELLGVELDESLRERALDTAAMLLVRATDQRIPASSEHDWYSLLSELARGDRSDAAIDAMLGLITSDKNIGMTPLIDRSLHLLFEQGLAQLLWQRGNSRLDSDDAEPIVWHLARARVLSWLPVELVLNWVEDKEARGASAMSLVNPYGEALPELARALLRRFGDKGLVAATLTSRVLTTPRAVNSLLDFKRRQLANLERWSLDEDLEVRRWAERLAERLREGIAEDEAHESFRRKLG